MICFSCKLNFKDKNMDIYRAWDMSFCSNCYYNLNQILNPSNNNNIWGPPSWTFLHTITFNYPNNPSEKDKQNYFTFFDSLKHVLPCDKCKKHYRDNSRDLKDNLNSRDDLVKW